MIFHNAVFLPITLSELDMYTLPAAIALIIITAGMFYQHKNIVYEDSRLHTDKFRLWSEISFMAAYPMLLPIVAKQFTEPLRTTDGLVEAWVSAASIFGLFLRSLLHFLKHRKKKGN